MLHNSVIRHCTYFQANILIPVLSNEKGVLDVQLR